MERDSGLGHGHQDTKPSHARSSAPSERLLLTVEEAAFRCSVSRSTMYELVGAGLIRSIVVGVRSRRVVAADLERWILAQTAETGSVPHG